MNKNPVIYYFVLLYLLEVISGRNIILLSDDFIDNINTRQTQWRAGKNFPLHTTLNTVKRMMGATKNSVLPYALGTMEHDPELIERLPESFDPRDKWPNCPTLNEIRNQGNCGSCWAFAAVGAMSDRYCIQSGEIKHFHFSAEDLLTCCPTCGFGCEGGLPILAWEYWMHFGIVSGGNYNSSQGCSSYQIAPCEFDVHGNTMPCSGISETPKCKKICREGYAVAYDKDKKYGKNMYSIRNEEDQIKAEIFTKGPVQGTFTVYADFVAYKSGVYKHVLGVNLGDHSVKIMGWGIENGNKYWLVANSWSSDWGDNGFFKILRGEDHCGIETSIVAGEPAFD